MKSCLLASALLCFAAQAYNFEMNGNVPVKWDITKSIRYSVDPNIPETNLFSAAAKRCFDRWAVASDNKISFIRNDTNYDIFITTGTEVHVPGEIGECDYSFHNGNLTYAKISFINTYIYTDDKTLVAAKDASIYGYLTSYIYIDDFMMHEIGHALGLAHPDLSKMNLPPGHVDDPTMASSQFYIGVGVELHVDDIQGLRALYGIKTPVDTTLPDIFCTHKGLKFTFMVSGETANIYWTTPPIRKNQSSASAYGNTFTLRLTRGKVYPITAILNGKTSVYNLDLRSPRQKAKDGQ